LRLIGFIDDKIIDLRTSIVRTYLVKNFYLYKHNERE